MSTKQRFNRWLITGLMIGAVMLAVLPGAAYAQDGDGLPDRTPPSVNDSDGRDTGSNLQGGYIELVALWHPGTWSVVQWQDINQNWQDVGGWQGTLDSRGVRRWWVDAKDFGSGPFRWVVGDSASPIAVSEPFNLPVVSGQMMAVTPVP